MASSGSGGSVLIASDGSEPAQNAIDHAARLFPGSPALVATVWRSVRPAAGAARAALPDDIIKRGGPQPRLNGASRGSADRRRGRHTRQQRRHVRLASGRLRRAVGLGESYLRRTHP